MSTDRVLRASLGVVVAGAIATAQTPPPMAFLAPVAFDSGEAEPADLDRADYNNDGLLDLALHTRGNGGEIHLLYGDGNGRLLKDPTLGVGLASGFGGGDFNGDGRRDLAVTLFGSSASGSYGLCQSVPGTIVFLGTTGPAPFAFSQCVPGHVGIDLHDVVAGDFTGDGRLDLAIADDGLWGMRVHRGNADGTFVTTPVRATGASGIRVFGPLQVLDVNGDGHMDVVARTGGPLGTAGGIGTFFGSGTGVLAFSSTAAAGAIAQHDGILAFALGDLNGDGAVDIAGVEQGRLTPGAAPQNWMFAALGSGTGRTYVTSFTAPFPAGSVGGVDLADFNRDAALDLAAVHESGKVARVHPGLGNGAFVTDAGSTVVPVGVDPRLVTSGDWNRDGWLDLAVVDVGSNTSSRTWVVQQVPRALETEPPTVTLTMPVPGQLLNGTVALSANATDNVGVTRVEFYAGGVLVATDATPPGPFVASWSTDLVVAGTYALTARAFDAAANTGLSPAVSVVVDRPPRANAGPPSTVDATSAAGASVTLFGSGTDADPGDALTFQWRNAVGAIVGNGPMLTTTLPIGTSVLTLRVTDTFGAWSESSVSVVVKDSPPTLRLPPNQSVTATGPGGAVVTFVASAVDLVDGARPVVCTPPSGATFLPGATTVTCTAQDTAGNIATGSFVVRVAAAQGPTYTRYLAEGATSSFFDTRLALVNPSNTTAASVTVTFQKSDATAVDHALLVPPRTRRTIEVKDVPGMANAEFSTVTTADHLVVVDRTMTWDERQYGSHAETSREGPATTWYLAEGATHSGFDLFYLMQNANVQTAAVTVSFLRPAPLPPIVKTYSVSGRSRFNLWVDLADGALAAAEVSAVIESSVPILVERAMYLSTGGLMFAAGHASAGVTSPATDWFLAEGATGPFFDLFLLVANPQPAPAAVTATYLLPNGSTVAKQYVIPGHSRFNIWVDREDAQLSDTAVSTVVASSVPVVVERTMWWGGASGWTEAHNSPGATTTGARWALAEGEQGGAHGTQTFILIANTSSAAGTVVVTLLFEDGTSAAKTIPLVPHSRFNLAVGAEFPRAADRRFGSVIESVGASPAQIVVERSMYADALGIPWASGTNALGTRLP